MEKWGAGLYGDPCGGCGFGWSLTPQEAIRIVEGLPARCRELLKGRTGHERHPDLVWNPAAYVSHVADNLRNWAERLAGARLSGAVDVPGYDPDLIAQARRYNEIAPAAALWSLERAVVAWSESVTAALDDGVVLQPPPGAPSARRTSRVTTRTTPTITHGTLSASLGTLQTRATAAMRRKRQAACYGLRPRPHSRMTTRPVRSLRSPMV